MNKPQGELNFVFFLYIFGGIGEAKQLHFNESRQAK